MKRILLTLTFAALAGCQGGSTDGSTSSATDEESTAELLQIGSPKACSTKDVRDTVISSVKPNFRPEGSTSGDDIELGLSEFSYSLEVVTLESVDQAVHNVTCEANLIIEDSDHGKKEFPIRYVVKPSVDEPESFVLSLRSGEAKMYLQNAVYEKIGQVRDERLANVAAEAPNLPADTSGQPVDTPDADTLEDVTNAIEAQGTNAPETAQPLN